MRSKKTNIISKQGINSCAKNACLLILLMVGVLCVSCSKNDKFSYNPPNGVIPDKETAVAVAEAVLIPIYGKETIIKERPFKATLREGIWYIEGSFPKQSKGTIAFGGVAEIEISKKNGTVIRICHGE